MSSSRELKNLWDQIEAGSYKPALVKINKELKKEPNHPYWLSLSAYVAYKQSHKHDALDLANRAAQLNPTNLTIISLIRDVYVAYGQDQQLSVLFEQAGRVNPGDEDLVHIWFDTMLERNNLRGLVKASIAFQKIAPTPRLATMQTCYFMALSYFADSTPAQEKRLYPMLASRMLEKLLPYTTAQECYVHALVLSMQQSDNATNNLIEYLDSPEVAGWESLDLVVLLLETLQKHKKWQKIFDYCRRFIEAQTMDNWLHWKALNEAAVHLGGNSIEVTRAFISKYEPASRNSRLALVDLLSRVSDPQFQSAVTTYFGALGTKRCAFEDLREYVQLPGFDSGRFLVEIAAHTNYQDDLNWQVNTEKLKFLFPSTNEAAIDNNLARFGKSEKYLEGKDPKDYHSGDDFLLIAAAKVLESEDPLKLYKAAVILEKAVVVDKHQFYVRLWLIRIYQLLGAHVRAKAHYDSLSIRNLQSENLPHVLVTRTGTLFPAKNTINASQDIYKQVGSVIPYAKHALSKGVFTQVESFLDLARKFEHSLTRRLMALETVKIDRLHTGRPNLRDLETLFGLTTVETMADNRDNDIMWDCNAMGETRLSERLTIGPTVRAEWIQATLLREQAIKQLAHGNLVELVFELDGLLEAGQSQFTDEEKWSFGVLKLMIDTSANKMSAAGYKAVSEQLTALKLEQVVPDARDPTTVGWQWFHRAFTIVETSRVVSGFVAKLKENRHQVKYDLNSAEALLDESKRVVAEVHSSAQSIKNGRSGRYNAVVEELSRWAEERNIGTSFVENIVDGVGAAQDKTLVLLRSMSL